VIAFAELACAVGRSHRWHVLRDCRGISGNDDHADHWPLQRRQRLLDELSV